MNRISLAIGSCLLAVGLAFTQPINPSQSQRKIQVAILFDTSNSMDGLIDQAKSRIWTIVNDLSGLKHQGQTPTIEIALYDYGNSGLTAESNYIRRQIDLTTDLDVISEKLFGLRTNGGSEFCGAVIGASIEELKWTSHPQDLRMIYIAGNEPFNQGKIDYKEVCKSAVQKDINVNTIYCGNYDQGVREFWFDGAKLGKGEYFNIDSDQQIVHINTPYDDQINAYNDSLNRTYYGYGAMGISGKMNQTTQDFNAVSESKSLKAERAIVKSKSNYTNASWDLIDAVEEGNKELSAIPEAELPDEFKGKNNEEKQKLLEEKKAERELYQKKINELAVERQKYIEEERKKTPIEGEADFGTSVQKSILKKANELGYEKE
jgi:hypothetical protein